MDTLSMLWHDFETTGVNPRKDRPAQFAGIRTDLDLNIIGEPIMIYCRPQPDHLPDPIACMITGITPQICMQHGIPEPEFAAKILSELGAPGTIGVGYNTLSFDDEVTRFMAWRNLHDPYAREWKNGCSRWDLINLARAAYAFRPEGINWPMNDKGRVSFKLEDLSKANGLLHEAAHDALSDVYATIALAKLIRDANPRLFKYFFDIRSKNEVAKHVSFSNPKPFIHVTGGADNGGVAIMYPIAQHPTNKNEVIAWDLAHDPSILADIDAETIKQRLFTRKEDLPEGVTRLPIKKITINKCPAVVSNLLVLSDERAQEIGIDKAACIANVPNVHRVVSSRNMARLFAEVYQQTNEPTDVDEALYSGFVADADRTSLDRIRADFGATTLRPKYQDEKLKELVLRYQARNNSAYLTTSEHEAWNEYLHQKLVVGAHGSRTFDSLRESIESLMQTATEKQAAILKQLLEYSEKVKSDLMFSKDKGVMPLEFHHMKASQDKAPPVMQSQVKTYDGLIGNLGENEVFVFGSNPQGINGNPTRRTGGASLVALENGWVQQYEKLDNCIASSGKAWGLTTISWPGKKRSRTPEQICDGIKILYQHAWNNPHKDFLVAYTAKARNLNGYTSEEMAAMFTSSPIPPNLVFESSFAALMRPESPAQEGVPARTRGPKP